MDLYWSRLKGVQRKMYWPVKVISWKDNNTVIVLCKTDNALIDGVSQDGLIPFPEILTKQKKHQTLDTFQNFLEWARGLTDTVQGKDETKSTLLQKGNQVKKRKQGVRLTNSGGGKDEPKSAPVQEGNQVKKRKRGAKSASTAQETKKVSTLPITNSSLQGLRSDTKPSLKLTPTLDMEQEMDYMSTLPVSAPIMSTLPVSTLPGSTPPESTAPGSTSLVSTPTKCTPLGSGSTPTKCTPPGSMPPESTTTKCTPSGSTPPESTPTKCTPPESTPTKCTPPGSTPVESTPREFTSTKCTQPGSSPPKSTPPESTPPGSAPMQSTPTKCTPRGSTAPESTPPESTPVVKVVETPDPREFKLSVLKESMSSLKKLEGEVKLKSEQLSALRIDPFTKDLSHEKEYYCQFEESCVKIEDYISVLEQGITYRRSVLDTCNLAEDFFNTQFDKAKTVANEYKSFDVQVTDMKKRLDDMMKTIPNTSSPCYPRQSKSPPFLKDLVIMLVLSLKVLWNIYINLPHSEMDLTDLDDDKDSDYTPESDSEADLESIRDSTADYEIMQDSEAMDLTDLDDDKDSDYKPESDSEADLESIRDSTADYEIIHDSEVNFDFID